jgi:hypothetical protein
LLSRANDFVAYLAGCSVEDWREVLQRAHAVETAAHAAALRRVTALVAAYPNAAALTALQDRACAAAPSEATAGAGSAASCSLAGRLATHAAFALAFREMLAPAEFAALYAPFARATRPERAAGDDGAPGTERRTVVAALTAVAAPLAPPHADDREP